MTSGDWTRGSVQSEYFIQQTARKVEQGLLKRVTEGFIEVYHEACENNIVAQIKLFSKKKKKEKKSCTMEVTANLHTGSERLLHTFTVEARQTEENLSRFGHGLQRREKRPSVEIKTHKQKKKTT